MKSSRPLALVLLLVALCAISVRADIALDGPWYAGSAAATVGTPSFSPNNTSASFTFGSGANDQSGTSALRALLWTYFDDVTLANDGDWVRVSFTAGWPTTALNNANALRFGLFDHNGNQPDEIT